MLPPTADSYALVTAFLHGDQETFREIIMTCDLPGTVAALTGFAATFVRHVAARDCEDPEEWWANWCKVVAGVEAGL